MSWDGMKYAWKLGVGNDGVVHFIFTLTGTHFYLHLCTKHGYGISVNTGQNKKMHRNWGK